MRLLPLCVIGLLAGALSLQAADPKPDAAKKDASKKASSGEKITSKEVAVIKTTEGTMVAEFYPDAAPKTVENFKKLAKSGFYDGTCFHRVIKGFMIQGGDPKTKDPSKESEWGTGGPGYTIKAEFNDHPHERGALSMARTADPDSAGSQFFICHGSPRFLDHQYTVFGKLIKGYDVLDKIATTPTHPPDRPDKRMGIESIKIVPASSIK
ncbi:MAG TPA: peptidylprolyl isomerase [Verrucomicrobiae bacterium]|nr:peptidylprolyl isomerase [Verrucomicrobiae bacterium]